MKPKISLDHRVLLNVGSFFSWQHCIVKLQFWYIFEFWYISLLFLFVFYNSNGSFYFISFFCLLYFFSLSLNWLNNWLHELIIALGDSFVCLFLFSWVNQEKVRRFKASCMRRVSLNLVLVLCRVGWGNVSQVFILGTVSPKRQINDWWVIRYSNAANCISSRHTNDIFGRTRLSVSATIQSLS